MATLSPPRTTTPGFCRKSAGKWNKQVYFGAKKKFGLHALESGNFHLYELCCKYGFLKFVLYQNRLGSILNTLGDGRLSCVAWAAPPSRSWPTALTRTRRPPFSPAERLATRWGASPSGGSCRHWGVRGGQVEAPPPAYPRPQAWPHPTCHSRLPSIPRGPMGCAASAAAPW